MIEHSTDYILWFWFFKIILFVWLFIVFVYCFLVACVNHSHECDHGQLRKLNKFFNQRTEEFLH